jgi:PhnB protein
MAKALPVPADHQGVIPYLCIEGVAKALEFYQKAFGAKVTERMDTPDGRVMHAEIKIGKAAVMMSEGCEEMQFFSPKKYGGSPVHLYLYVDDVDAFAAHAVKNGATLKKECQTQFYGDRSCGIEDPFGHMWGFAMRVEEVSKEEMHRRAAALFAGAGAK